MKTKLKTLKLSHPHVSRQSSNAYRVEMVTDSVELTPYQLLEKKQVDELCCAQDWKVTIIHFTE
jgi:hypothetical protein